MQPAGAAQIERLGCDRTRVPVELARGTMKRMDVGLCSIVPYRYELCCTEMNSSLCCPVLVFAEAARSADLARASCDVKRCGVNAARVALGTPCRASGRRCRPDVSGNRNAV